jgi:16S rRNA (uracil1498-N3)-methyltransferase
MHLFYCPGDHTDYIHLDTSESKHCIKVLRLTKNEEVGVINGQGVLYKTRIVFPDLKHTTLKVITSIKNYGKRNYYLHIAIAPPKNIERFEWFLEKVTEIGIDEITPVYCHRSERLKLRTERLEKIILSAVKQSQKAYMPLLNMPVKYNDFIENISDIGKYIAYCSEKNQNYLVLVPEINKKNLVIIGPEGDFTPLEIENALANGFIPVSLGQSRYRTETAGVVTAQIISDRYIIQSQRESL